MRTETITISQSTTTLPAVIVRHVLVWGFLIGAAGLSRVWFGGAWIIDLTILFLLIGWLIGVAKRELGKHVEITYEELRQWVLAGQPRDIREWLDVWRATNG